MTNPGASKNQGVTGVNGTLYPDVVVIEPSGTRATAIAEVETSDSVTDAESKQWLDYARLGVESFNLVAPRAKIAAAAAICARNGVKVTQFWQYEMAGTAVTFSQYVPP